MYPRRRDVLHPISPTLIGARAGVRGASFRQLLDGDEWEEADEGRGGEERRGGVWGGEAGNGDEEEKNLFQSAYG